MILNFSCSNYRSIKEEIRFSMCATSDQEHQEQLKTVNSIKVVRNAALYGANGSGKSSFISAIKTMKRLIYNSMNLQLGDMISRMPHKLSDITEPTCFKMQFMIEDVRYLYGIAYTEKEIKEEYLYYYPNGRQAKIFDRDSEGITYGDKFKKELNQVSENMLKPNKLLLSCAANFTNIAETEKVFLFFKNDIVVYQSSAYSHKQDEKWIKYTAIALQESKELKKIFVNFSKYIGSDLINVLAKYEKKKTDIHDIPESMPEELRSLFLGGERETVDLKVFYDKFELEVDEESEGIKKLFCILCPIFEVLLKGKVLIFDEIETSLHPSIVREIINLFINTGQEKFAQLIFSTHDAMLLDLGLFRRDQIWFTELKRESHSTDLYSLAELKNIRKDENIMKGYILGKYGAIPMINKELTQIFDRE